MRFCLLPEVFGIQQYDGGLALREKLQAAFENVLSNESGKRLASALPVFSFGGRFLRINKLQSQSLVDICAFDKSLEREQVMGIQACDRTGGRCPQSSLAGSHRGFILGNVQRPDVMPRHRLGHNRRHYPQILSDEPRACSVGLEAQDRVHFFGGILNVEPVFSSEAVRNPEEPVKTHDMIDSQQFCVAKMIADVGNRISITIRSHGFGMHRIERPVLSSCEDRVRRRTAADALHKELGITPRIEAVRMKAQRQIEIEQTSRGLAVIRKFAELSLNEPLSVEIVLLGIFLS